MVAMDVPPYCTAQGDRAELAGLNTVGLTRHGFTEEQSRADEGRLPDPLPLEAGPQRGAGRGCKAELRRAPRDRPRCSTSSPPASAASPADAVQACRTPSASSPAAAGCPASSPRRRRRRASACTRWRTWARPTRRSPTTVDLAQLGAGGAGRARSLDALQRQGVTQGGDGRRHRPGALAHPGAGRPRRPEDAGRGCARCATTSCCARWPATSRTSGVEDRRRHRLRAAACWCAEGHLAGPQPTEAQQARRRRWAANVAARARARPTSGQTVVVTRGVVLAVEAVEGTDEAHSPRAARSAATGAVVVKRAKPRPGPALRPARGRAGDARGDARGRRRGARARRGAEPDARLRGAVSPRQPARHQPGGAEDELSATLRRAPAGSATSRRCRWR